MPGAFQRKKILACLSGKMGHCQPMAGNCRTITYLALYGASFDNRKFLAYIETPQPRPGL